MQTQAINTIRTGDIESKAQALRDELTLGQLKQENRVLNEAIDRLKEMLVEEKIPKDCEHCRHFVQHYIKNIGGMYKTDYTALYYGHCVLGRSKRKNSEETCNRFTLGTLAERHTRRGCGL